MPLAYTSYPAEAENRNTGEQKLHNAHKRPTFRWHFVDYAIRVIDKILSSEPRWQEVVSGVLNRVRVLCGSRGDATRMRSGRATIADCAGSADSVSTMRPLRLIVLNASKRGNLVFYTSLHSRLFFCNMAK